MSDFDKLKNTLKAIGVEYQIETVVDFTVHWYGFPAGWNGNLSLRAVGAQFVFDDNGRFLGVGIGDEQTSVDYRQDDA